MFFRAIVGAMAAVIIVLFLRLRVVDFPSLHSGPADTTPLAPTALYIFAFVSGVSAKFLFSPRSKASPRSAEAPEKRFVQKSELTFPPPRDSSDASPSPVPLSKLVQPSSVLRSSTMLEKGLWAEVKVGAEHLRLFSEHGTIGVQASVYNVNAKNWIAPSESVDDIDQGKDRAAQHARDYLRKVAGLELPSLTWKKSRSA